jgi:hypothetical protein
MKHIHLEEFDQTSVDIEMSLPEQSLRDLICITEESIQALAGQMDVMTQNVADMTQVLGDKLPAVVEKLEELIKVINENTEKGMAKTDELMKALEKNND